MAGHSTRSEQLWLFAQRLLEEETTYNLLPQQEEFGQRIRVKYDQLVSNLSCVEDIIVKMYENNKLSQKEFDEIHKLQLTSQIRANEELLSIISKKSRDVFEYFLLLVKETNQPHLHQMLVSGENMYDEANWKSLPDHAALIRRSFSSLSDELETELGLSSQLYQEKVLTQREYEFIFRQNRRFDRNVSLLGLISRKSPRDFETFLIALDASGQGHLAQELRNPEDGSLPTVIPNLGEEFVPPRSVPKPAVPESDNLSTSAQHPSMPIRTVVKSGEEIINSRRVERLKFQARLKELESRLQTDIEIKVICKKEIKVIHKRTEDCSMTYTSILLRECHQLKKEILVMKKEKNVELEQLKKTARQYSAAATVTETLRTQLQQELEAERLQGEKVRMQLKKQIIQLETVILDDKVKWENIEEDNRILKLQEELNSKQLRKQEIEDKLNYAVQLNSQIKGRNMTFAKENQMIRNYYQFLMQKIKPSRVIDFLNEENCITDEERSRMLNQPGNVYKNEALLQWMRTIPLTESYGHKVLECFRRAGQDFIADLFATGGVLIESKIWTKRMISLRPYQQESLDGRYKKNIMPSVFERLDQSQGVALSKSADAKDIVIAPFYYREADGIVLWFWCQSDIGHNNLRGAYESGSLLREVNTFFIESCTDMPVDSISPVPVTSIYMFKNDLKDSSEFQYKFKSKLHLLQNLTPKDAGEGMQPIIGFTILDKELFVVRKVTPQIEVYNLTKMSFCRSSSLKESIAIKEGESFEPIDIVSCSGNKCLYILNKAGLLGQGNGILRFDPNGKLMNKWSTYEDETYGLSVTDESKVILAVHQKHKLYEYLPDGQFIREIVLPSDIIFPYHAIKLTESHFVISYKQSNGVLGFCVVDANGNLIRDIYRKATGPAFLTIDRAGFVLVPDEDNCNILLFDSNLNSKREIKLWDLYPYASWPDRFRILMDDTSNRIAVASTGLKRSEEIMIFQF